MTIFYTALMLMGTAILTWIGIIFNRFSIEAVGVAVPLSLSGISLALLHANTITEETATIISLVALLLMVVTAICSLFKTKMVKKP